MATVELCLLLVKTHARKKANANSHFHRHTMSFLLIVYTVNVLCVIRETLTDSEAKYVVSHHSRHHVAR